MKGSRLVRSVIIIAAISIILYYIGIWSHLLTPPDRSERLMSADIVAVIICGFLIGIMSLRRTRKD